MLPIKEISLFVMKASHMPGLSQKLSSTSLYNWPGTVQGESSLQLMCFGGHSSAGCLLSVTILPVAVHDISHIRSYKFTMQEKQSCLNVNHYFSVKLILLLQKY